VVPDGGSDGECGAAGIDAGRGHDGGVSVDFTFFPSSSRISLSKIWYIIDKIGKWIVGMNRA
jgi:hypothetical protein